MEFRDLKIQYSILESEIDAAIKKVCSKADFISGDSVKELENKLAQYVGAKYCVSCANGTDALVLSLMALGVGEGDAVFVPDFTFFSTAESVCNVGAVPIFVDIDSSSYNISAVDLEKAINRIKNEGELFPKAVIAVDLFGLPADYLAIKDLCAKYDLLLVEDGAQGFGGRIGGKKCCSFGDISTTSFFPAKPLGCYGDGGAIFTDNYEWASMIRSYAVHGKGECKYDNVRIGMNSRLDTIQAAILLVKLRAFEKYELYDINNVANMYNEYLKQSRVELPCVPNDFYSSWAQYTIKLPLDVDRSRLMEKLKMNEIPTMVYYRKPMHLQGAFVGKVSANVNTVVTEDVCSRVLSLPIHPYMSENDVVLVTRELLAIEGIK